MLKLVFLNFIISFALLEMFLIDLVSLVAVSGNCILNIQISRITAGLFLDWPQMNPSRVNQHNNLELLIQKASSQHVGFLWISSSCWQQPIITLCCTTGGRQINENPWKKNVFEEHKWIIKHRKATAYYTRLHINQQQSTSPFSLRICFTSVTSLLVSFKLLFIQAVCLWGFSCVLAFYKLLKHLHFFSSSAPAVFRCRILSELCWSSHDAFNTHITKTPCFDPGFWHVF